MRLGGIDGMGGDRDMRKRYLVFYTKPGGKPGCDTVTLYRKGKLTQNDVEQINKNVREKSGGTVTGIRDLN